MNTLTPKAIKEIERLNASFPRIQRKNPDGSLKTRKVQRRILGKDLPKEYKRKFDWLPNNWYLHRINEPVFMNHKLNLIECFKKDGYEGLKNYENALKSFMAKQEAEDKIIFKKISWWKRLFKRKKTA